MLPVHRKRTFGPTTSSYGGLLPCFNGDVTPNPTPTPTSKPTPVPVASSSSSSSDSSSSEEVQTGECGALPVEVKGKRVVANAKSFSACDCSVLCLANDAEAYVFKLPRKEGKSGRCSWVKKAKCSARRVSGQLLAGGLLEDFAIGECN